MASLFTAGKFQAIGDAGPISGALLYTYAAGDINTPLATYTDQAGASENDNPVECDEKGQAAVWLGSNAYLMVLKTPDGVTVWQEDNITNTDGRLAASSGSSLVGFIHSLAGATATTLQARGRLEVWSSDFGHSPSASAATNDAALLEAITRVYGAGGGTIRVPAGVLSHITVSYNWAAGVTVNIVGSGQRATYLQKSGATTSPVLDFSADVGVLDTYSTVSDLTIVGNAKGHHGLRATRLANITTRNLGIQACNVGFESVGCLVAIHERPEWQSNNIGFRSRKNTAGGNIYCNLVSFKGGSIRGNTTFGVDLGDASGVSYDGTKIDLNGTAANTATGGMMVRDTVDDENGFAQLLLENVYFEANLGRTFQTEDASGLDLTMINVLLLSPESNRSANIGAIHGVKMIQCQAPSAGDTVTIGACQYSCIEGGTINTVTDTSLRQTRQPFTSSGGLNRDSVTSFTVGSGGLRIDGSTTVKNALATFTQGDVIVQFQDGAGSGNSLSLYATNGANGNVAATHLRTGTNSSTGRSINAGGTVNASGADYAEYETKRDDCGAIAKGDIVGFDADGLLTDQWGLAETFGVKSTSPSLVGGDNWFSEDRPTNEEEVPGFEQRLELARQKVDRIAYAGKVPVNVTGAQLGDYIVPVESDGGIAGLAVSDPTLEQYMTAVGRVRAFGPDGRPIIVVKAL